MASIDRISIKISADASSATKSVNNLVKSVEKLNTALGSLNVGNLTAFSNAVKDLANSVTNLNKGTESVRETARAFRDLGKASSSVKKATEATQNLAHTSTSLSVVSNNVNEVANVSNILLEVFQRILSGFNGLEGGSRKLIGDFDIIETAFRETTDESYQMVSAFDAVIAAFERMVMAFGSKPALGGSGQKLIEEQGIFDTTWREMSDETAANMEGMAQSMEHAAASARDLNSAGLENVSTSAERVSSGFLKTSNVVDNLKSKFKNIFVPTKSFQALEEQINKVVNKYNELLRKMQEAVQSGKMSVGDKAYEQMSAQLDALRNKYDELILKQKQLAQEGNAIRLNPNVEKSLGAFKSGFTSVTNLVKNGFVAGIKSANTHLKAFKTRIRETISGIGKSITSGHKATDMAKKFAKELLRVSKMLKLMVTRMALRAVIKEVGNGFKSLALHSQEFNQSVSSMMNGAKKLGYSFAAMVSPLVNALAPAINYVINLLTKLLNIINQVFSVFTGKTTYNRSKDFTENWAENIESANKSAKELKKTVLGFDELNQLQEKYSGGGDTSGNIEDMFETVEIDPKWIEFANWLKDMWNMGDFTELGKKLGEDLRDLLESIPWDDIKDTAGKLGTALATLINGFVEVERLGYDIGKTMAESVNTVFEFLNDFVHNLHWDSIGKFIAETLNGFFENIDWPLIKDTVVTGMAGIATSIQNFIDNFHWDNISNFIINAVDTVVSGVRAFFENIDWLDLGQKMGEQITKSIEGIDWYDMGVAIGDVIQAAVNWVTGILDTLPSVEELVAKATELIQGLFDKVDMEQMGANLANIFNYIYNFLVGFWTENGPTIKEEVKKFFKGFWDTIDKEDLTKVVGKIIEAAIIGGIVYALGAFAKAYLAHKFNQLIGKVAGDATVTAAASSAGSKLGGIFKAAFIGAIAIGIGNWVIDFGLKSWGNAILKGMREGGYSEEDIEKKRRDLESLEERYDGLSGKVQLLKDGFTGFKDVELPSDKIKECAIQVEDLRVPVIRLGEDGKALETDMKKSSAGVANSVGTISRTVNAETVQIKKDFDDIKITVEKDTEGIKNSTNTITFKPISDAVFKLDGDTKTAFGNAAKTVSNYSIEVSDVALQVANSGAEMSGTWTELAKTTSTETSDMAKAVEDSTKDMTESLDTVKDAMSEKEWTFDGVGDGLKKTFEKAKEGIKSVWNSIAEKLNGEYELGNGKFKIKLPTFAYGGFPDEDGIFMANHTEMVGRFSNGRTAVANNAQIVEGISAGVYNAVSSAMANNSNSGTGYIANTIVVDGEVIARTITKAQNKQNMRYSPSMG